MRLQADLERDECLIANGFVFATGEVVVLTPDAKISKRLMRDAAVEQELGFASLAMICNASSNEWEARAGETSRQGEGFVALFRAGVVVWVLILDWSEPFNSVHLAGSVITAVSGDYPSRMRWIIPVANPLAFKLERQRAT